MRGKFIVIEGLDGCGKSTQVDLLGRWLKSQAKKVVHTGEPTNGEIGKIIKSILRGELKVPVESEVLLFAADRMQHLSSLILPSLKKGAIVLNERYVHSSLAYQCARGAPEHLVRMANANASPPDLAIFIDVPVKMAMERVQKARSPDKFEEDMKLQKKVRKNYLKYVKKGELEIVDGSRPPMEVQQEIRALVSRLLKH
ncbi:MAG: dTMP kinase [Candidatus Hadarchaeales archaeon]